MFYKKSLLTLSAVLGLGGCFSKHYYVLSTPSQPEQTYAKSTLSIGVEKVTVPEYLFKRDIAMAKSTSEVTFVSDGTWAEDMDSGLTTRLISFLQKKFNAPRVHLYPWDTNTQPTKKVKVEISRFIAQGEMVYLDATWEVVTLRNQHKKAKLFQVAQPIEGTSTSQMVKAMNNAFAKLEEEVAKGVRN